MKALPYLMALLAASTGCGGIAGDEHAVAQPFTSDQAVLLDFAFEGELVTRTLDPRTAIDLQLNYAVGQLNGERAGLELGRLDLTDVTVTQQEDGRHVRYAARVPVAWTGAPKLVVYGEVERASKPATLPETYTLLLPRRIDPRALEQFTARYGVASGCLNPTARGVYADNHWYHYRPTEEGCRLAPDEVSAFEARVTKSPRNTTGKYPEFDRLWEDGQLDVVVVFGMYAPGAGALRDDRGGKNFYSLIDTLAVDLQYDLTWERFPDAAPVELTWLSEREAILRSTFLDGRRVQLRALLIDSAARPPPSFEGWFREQSSLADLVLYAGHSEYGESLTRLGELLDLRVSKYRILFLDGCNTFTYLGKRLDHATALGNLDVVSNAMPTPVADTLTNALFLIRALAGAPQTYEALFSTSIMRGQVVSVSGEEDNTFTP